MKITMSNKNTNQQNVTTQSPLLGEGLGMGYLTIAFRTLLRHKFQTLFTVVGLAVAMFCFGICLYFVRGYLTIDHCFPGHDRIVRVSYNGNTSIQPDSLEQLKLLIPHLENI